MSKRKEISSTQRTWLIIGITFFAIILLDQCTKFYVKTHFYLGENYWIADWFQIVFHENNGMAFSMEMGNKLFLSLFRVVVVGFLAYFVARCIKEGRKLGFVVGMTMVVAGAVGNIIDCLFYGVWFSSSQGQIATFLPEAGGYSSFLYGKVVDMLYFPLIHSSFPDWMPWVGGQRFTFFSPVFNIADSFICIGVFYLLIFQNKALREAFGEDKINESKK